jgi:hypothetical protein
MQCVTRENNKLYTLENLYTANHIPHVDLGLIFLFKIAVPKRSRVLLVETESRTFHEGSSARARTLNYSWRA